MSEPIDGLRSNVFFSDSQPPTAAPSGTMAVDATVPEGFVVVNPAFAERLTSQHSAWFEATLGETEEFTADIPNVGSEGGHLDARGVPKVGSAVKPGTILVGKVGERGATPSSPEEKLLRAIFGEKAGDVLDRSLRAPALCFGTVSAVEFSPGTARVQVSWSRVLEPGDELDFDGQRRVVSAIRKVAGDFATTGVSANARVTKVSCARDELCVRGTGAYEPHTQLPVDGAVLEPRLQEVLAAHAPWMLWETMTLKADAVMGRSRAFEALVRQKNPAQDVRDEPGAAS